LQTKHATNVRNGTLDAYTRWESIIKEIDNETVSIALREDVGKRIREWDRIGSTERIESVQCVTYSVKEVSLVHEVYMVD
jgi:hypothetical protein